jgi:hypothetical protein
MEYKEKTLCQVSAFREAMDNAINKGLGMDDEDNERFYNSSFRLTFCDKVGGHDKSIDLIICPETWEAIENLLADIPQILEDY